MSWIYHRCRGTIKVERRYGLFRPPGSCRSHCGGLRPSEELTLKPSHPYSHPLSRDVNDNAHDDCTRRTTTVHCSTACSQQLCRPGSGTTNESQTIHWPVRLVIPVSLPAIPPPRVDPGILTGIIAMREPIPWRSSSVWYQQEKSAWRKSLTKLTDSVLYNSAESRSTADVLGRISATDVSRRS